MPDWRNLISQRLPGERLHGGPETEILEELATHFEDIYQDALGRGVTEDAAQARALNEVNDWGLLATRIRRVRKGAARSSVAHRVELTEHALRERGGLATSLADVLLDLRVTFRRLRNSPIYTTVGILTLALAIAGTTAIFSVVNGIMLRPLPYPEPENLVNLWQVNEEWQGASDPQRQSLAREFPISLPVLHDWNELSSVLEDVGGYDSPIFTILGDDRSERLQGTRMTSGAWSALDVPPLLGRTFTAQDDEVGAAPVAVLSYGIWKSRFGGDPSVLGRPLRLRAGDHEIVGVMPPGFYFPDLLNSSLWTTLPNEEKAEGREGAFLEAIGRLRLGVTLPEAQGEMKAVTLRMVENRGHDPNWGVRVVPRKQQVVGDTRLVLALLLGAVCVVQLIGCANIANMMLARTTSRQNEMACRTALGASRRHLLRLPLFESLALSIAGGMAGFLLVALVFKPLLSMLPGELPRASEIVLDVRVFAFTALVSIFTGILAGSLPALRSAATDPASRMRDGGRGHAGSRQGNRVQRVLVIAEVALAFVLLVGAGLLVESFLRLTAVNRGLNADQVLAFDLFIPSEILPAQGVGMPTDQRQFTSARQAQTLTFIDELEERLRSVSGVTQVAIADALPFMSSSGAAKVVFDSGPSDHSVFAEHSAVTPEYFKTLGIPVLSGRSFMPSDGPADETVVVVSRTMAEQCWPGKDPIGRRIKTGDHSSEDPWRIVIGVAEDVRHHGLGVVPRPKMYRPLAQAPFGPQRSRIRVALKTRMAAGSVVTAARDVIAGIDPRLAPPEVRRLEDVIASSVDAPRFRTRLMASFALLAGLLAVLGVYGVLAHAMTQRRAEVGIRKALGANETEIMTFALTQGLAPALIGIALGAAIALAATSVLRSYLFETEIYNPVVFATVALTLILAAFAASYAPSRQAAKADPVEALRLGTS